MTLPIGHLSAVELQAFLDGRTPPSERERIQTHLHACVECASELEAWRPVFSGLEGLGHVELPEGFAGRVMDRVTAELHGAHLGVEDLLAYLDGSLDGAAARTAEHHLAACASCGAAEAEWARVFEALARPGHLAPAAGFADQVILKARTAGVTMASDPALSPAPIAGVVAPVTGPGRLARARAWAGRAAARVRASGRGRWPVLAGIGTAPAAVVATLGWVVFTHPLVTAGGLAQFLWFKANQFVEGAVATLVGGAAGTSAFAWVSDAVQYAANAPGLAALGAVSLLVATSGSIWVLYRNLGLGRASLTPARLNPGTK